MATEERYQDQIRFFSQSADGTDGEAVQQRLARLRIAAFGTGVVASNSLSALEASGVSNVKSATKESLLPEIEAADVVVVALDAPAPKLMHAINLAALQTKTPWVSAQIHTGTGWIGPMIIPGQTPCYTCYELRRNANLQNYNEVMHYETRIDEMPSIVSRLVAPAPLAACVGALLALETLRLLSGVAMPQTMGRLMRVDFFDSELTYHRVLRLPRCPACGHAPQSTS